MKNLLAVLLCFGLVCSMSVTLVGCKKPEDKTTKKTDGTKPPTGPTGDVGKAKLAIVAEVADPGKTTLGTETKEVTAKITLARGENADKKVTFTVAIDPKDKGVTAEAADVAGKDKEGTLKISVAKTATVGDYKITVTAKSEGSPDAEAKPVTLKVEAAAAVVPAKKYEITIADGAKDGTKIIAGKDAKVKVAATLEADETEVTFAGGAKDAKDKAVEGIKVSADKIAKSGDVTVTIVVDAKVAAGEYTAWVTGTGKEGKKEATSKLKVIVAAP